MWCFVLYCLARMVSGLGFSILLLTLPTLSSTCQRKTNDAPYPTHKNVMFKLYIISTFIIRYM